MKKVTRPSFPAGVGRVWERDYNGHQGLELLIGGAQERLQAVIISEFGGGQCNFLLLRFFNTVHVIDLIYLTTQLAIR